MKAVLFGTLKKNGSIFSILKHGVSFKEAERAFGDPKRKIDIDRVHSGEEPRFFCCGHVGRGILTVRFTYRDGPNTNQSKQRGDWGRPGCHQ